MFFIFIYTHFGQTLRTHTLLLGFFNNNEFLKHFKTEYSSQNNQQVKTKQTTAKSKNELAGTKFRSPAGVLWPKKKPNDRRKKLFRSPETSTLN